MIVEKAFYDEKMADTTAKKDAPSGDCEEPCLMPT